MLIFRKTPTKQSFGLLFAALVAALLSLSGCEACNSERPMAILSIREGLVDRDTNENLEQWLRADVGATFQVGEGLKTGEKSGAQVTLDDGSILALEEKTLVRFLERPPGSTDQALDLQLGSASLEASDKGAVLRTLFGQATLEGGTKIELVRSEGDLRFNIKVGSAILEGNDGKSVELKGGQTISITMGGAVLEEADEAPKESTAEENEVGAPSGVLLADVSGTAVRMKGPEEAGYSKLAAGRATLEAGSTLEVGANSSVIVTQGDNKAQLATGGTYVVGTGDQLVSAQSGSVEVTSEGNVRIKVPGGVIITRGGSSTITALGNKGTQVKANSGKVTLKGKEEETLREGEEGILSLKGDISVDGRGLSYADVETNSGENLVIHDPKPPTAVRFLFGDACEEGTIRLKGTPQSVPQAKYAQGTKSVALPLGVGRIDYTLHCIDDKGAEGPAKMTGRVTVLQDAGSRPVPKTAPSTFVEVNGRAYTVLYQNLLPHVTVKWSKAPSDVGSFKLHVRGPSGARTLSSVGPTYSFRSGSLGEGTHTIYFEGGERVSRQTSVTILFDNATPTASLSTPPISGAKPGSDVTLAGMALPGWDVEVDGRTIGQDAGSRFSVKTKVPKDGRPVSVRLTHPTRGTHVYLRRTASD